MLGRTEIGARVGPTNLSNRILEVALEVPISCISSIFTGVSTIPPPHETNRLRSLWSERSAEVSSSRKRPSPSVSKISVTDLPQRRTTRRSVSIKRRLNMVPTLRASVDLPAPKKPIKKIWSQPCLMCWDMTRPIPRREGRAGPGAQRYGRSAYTTGPASPAALPGWYRRRRSCRSTRPCRADHRSAQPRRLWRRGA